MTDVSNQLFLCYAWDDMACIKQLLPEIEHEIGAKISSDLHTRNFSDLDEAIKNRITEADIFIVFLSDAAKKSEFVRQCVAFASHINKNILPIYVNKTGLFGSKTPQEFKFRSEPYSYTNPKSKATFFAQLKAALGLNTEGGDSFGALVHIITDREVRIKRYGELIGYAQPGKDCQIRLVKGDHQLQIEDVHTPSSVTFLTVTIADYDSERFVNIRFNNIEQQSGKKISAWKSVIIIFLITGLLCCIVLYRNNHATSDVSPYQEEAEIEVTDKDQIEYGNLTPGSSSTILATEIMYEVDNEAAEAMNEPVIEEAISTPENNETDINTVYYEVEVQAEFPGGDRARRQWIRDHI
ncbi:MAG: toll/interleukin-1 receptor domain-containing protein, partial [Duncaniella sp.]|nr:toll/interleukin-1 receptor domain-containing protein [Duncaniella sp.]